MFRFIAAFSLCFVVVYSDKCHDLFKVPLSELSPDDVYSDKDVENGTICICKLKPCFLQCCPEGYSPSVTDKKRCLPDDDHTFSLSHYKGGPYPSDFSLRTGFPCDDAFWDFEYISLLPNGSLLSSEGHLSPGQFCLEFSLKRNAYLPYTCFPEEEEEESKFAAVYPFGMLISIPFFLATLIVYAIIPELRNTLHGLSFMCHLLCLIVGYGAIAAVQLDTAFESFEFSYTTCTVLAYIMQFAFLATFFWMNVMCFDIWWTFSSLKKPGGSVRERDLKKFLLYSAYAWGLPLVILIITLIMDYSNILAPNAKLKPQMGENKCFFKTAAATWLYLYGPIAVLIVANLIMFAFTAKKIFLHTKETQVLKSEDSKRHDSKDRERFNLYLKLFVVMGVNWVAELVSWAVESKSNFWYITDITNTLQGVIIFIIFVCKPRVLRLLEQAVCPGRAARRNTIHSSSRSRNTTTSIVNGSSRQAQQPETVQLRAVTHDSDSNM